MPVGTLVGVKTKGDPLQTGAKTVSLKEGIGLTVAANVKSLP